MTTTASLILAGVLIAPGISSAAAVVQETFYVSPTGSDSSDGLSPATAFKTIQHAREEVDELNDAMTGDIVVNVKAGDYFVTSAIVLDEGDGGTNGHKVRYVAADGPGTARLIGGKKVTGAWTLVDNDSPAVPADADLPEAADDKVYKTNVSALLGADKDVNSLYVGDARVTMARTPNKANDPRFPAHNGAYATTASGALRSFVYRSTEINGASLTGMTNAVARGDLDAQVYVWERGKKDWSTSTLPLGSINTTTRTIAAKEVSGHDELNRPHWAIGGGASCCDARYFLQGNLGFLDVVGEYYLNKTSGDLYYYPASASDLTVKQIVLPTIETLIDIRGAARDSQAKDIVLDGLQVGATDFPSYYSSGWNAFDDMGGIGSFCPEAGGSAMPSYCEFTERAQFKAGAISVRNATHIEISRAHVRNAGMFGVGIFEGADNITIQDSLVEESGLSGVIIDGGYPLLNGDDAGNSYTHHNTVTNSVIRNVGRLAGHVTGVGIKNSNNNTVSHSEISGSPRSLLNVTGGWARRMDLAFPNGDGSFARQKHMYAHDNTFTHLYLHDGQQDGGDDGSIFGAMLYFGNGAQGTGDFDAPNTINQVVIDRIGAHPSMKDIAPNGINLDMGASGFTLSNVKVINPHQYNMQVNTLVQYGDEIHFNNTNIDYGRIAYRLPEFDDSLMEYDDIGVDLTSFPTAYAMASNPGFHDLAAPTGAWFSDSFEGAGLDTTKWRFIGAEPRLTPQFAAEGVGGLHRSLQIDSGTQPTDAKPVVIREFADPVSKVVTIRFFDRASQELVPYDSGAPISEVVKSLARVDAGGASVVGLGVDTGTSLSHYVHQIGGTTVTTPVARSYGWHELKWEYSSSADVKLSIDGVEVGTSTARSFSQIQLGSTDGLGASYYDRVVVEAGSGGGTAPALSKSPANLSYYASVTSSSAYADAGSPWKKNYSPWNVADGIVGWNGRGEWATTTADANRWVKLTWAQPRLLNSVVLADRPNTSDQVTRGRLVFSDGSTEPVTALPDAGGRFRVDFIPRQATSVTFEIESSRGLPGLAEFEAYGNAAVTASSFYTNPVSGQMFTPDKAVDGVIGQWGPGEWAVSATDSAPWIKLEWPLSRPLNQVVLYDRPNTFDRVLGGTLEFSDGSTIAVGALDNAGAPAFVKFASKNVTWVKFSLTSTQGLPGLSEFRAESAPDPGRVATPSTLSAYTSNYSAARLNDGIIGVAGSGEWAALTTAVPTWAQLTWPNAVSLDTVVLYDRPNLTDQVTAGTLEFSDGSSVAVTALPNDGSAKVVNFAARAVTSVKFVITAATGLPGLSEFEAR
ncbi:UNVERIFIED_CONTAM: right-handed parallel beta-helix repeat-containing protein [Microbacterium sp. SLM126]